MASRRAFLTCLSAGMATMGLPGSAVSAGVASTTRSPEQQPAAGASRSRRSCRCCPRTARTPSASPSPARRDSRRSRSRPFRRGRGSRRDSRGVAEDRPARAFGDERRSLALSVVEQRSRNRQPQRARDGDVDQERHLVGLRHGAPRARRRRCQHAVSRGLDAFAACHPGAAAAGRARRQDRHCRRRGLEQVPAQPARIRALCRRVRVAVGESVLRRRQRRHLRLSAGLDSHARPAHREGPPQGLQLRSRRTAASPGRISARGTSTGRRCAARFRRSATTATSRPSWRPATRPT